MLIEELVMIFWLSTGEETNQKGIERNCRVR